MSERFHLRQKEDFITYHLHSLSSALCELLFTFRKMVFVWHMVNSQYIFLKKKKNEQMNN